MKKYKVVDPAVSQEIMVKTLSEALERDLTEQELRTITWLSDCDYTTVGVITDLFKELADKR